MSFDYPGRVSRLRDVMAERGVELVLLSVGADLPYFTGYEAMASERLTVAAITPREPTVLFIPRLEMPRVESEHVEIVAWDENEDPVQLLAARFGPVRTAAIGDHTWSVFMVRLIDAFPGCSWSPASELTGVLRRVKDQHEIEALRHAAAAVDRVLARVANVLRFSGRSEMEVSGDLAAMTIEEGHQSAEFSIVASGPNGASPHHEPGKRIIEEGDLVVCDFGGRLDSYCSDVTRTFSVGEPGARQVEVHEVVLAANEAARSAVAPGVQCQQIDRAARQVIEAAGYGESFIHRTGHGIGMEVHEHPYMVEGNAETLQPGMTFSVEPGIYLPGRLGVRIEDIVACDVSGVSELNRAERSLVVVE